MLDCNLKLSLLMGCMLTSNVALAKKGCEPTIHDAIALTRIQESVPSILGPIAAVSPDGRRFAVVVWSGDLTRNLNVYSLLLFESDGSGRRLGAPRKIAVREFRGYSNGDDASAFEQVKFLADNHTIAFLGQDERNTAQVFTIDSLSGEVLQLSHTLSPVRSYVVGSTGDLRAYSTVATQPGAEQKAKRLDEDGVFLWDPSLFEQRGRFMKSAPFVNVAAPDQVREYFRVTPSGTRQFFNSIQSRPAVPLDLNDPEVASGPTKELHEEKTFRHWATFTADGRGRRALLFPYGLTDHPMHAQRWDYYQDTNHYTRRVAAPYGVVDLVTGRIERLIDAPHPQFEFSRGGGDAVWSPEGSSVVIYTLDPITGDETAQAQAKTQFPHWVEVNLDTRQTLSVPAPQGWSVVSWEQIGFGALILQKDNRVGRIARTQDGHWNAFEEVGVVSDLSRRFQVATNGHIALGVKEAPDTAPEFVSVNLKSGKTTVLTDLNPQLRTLCLGSIETIQWFSAHERNSGFITKPASFQTGTRYPLVILLDDGFLGQNSMPFIFDGVEQLNAFAPQALAAHNFIVLYARSPPSMVELEETMDGGERMREMVESAITTLDRAGLIDPNRVGLSGWSRAAYYVDHILIHSSFPFTAASQIDGGAVEYVQGARPFRDSELDKIGAPILFEPHNVGSLVNMAAMADRLESLGSPTEILYFHTVAHDVVRPQHRLRSLAVHMDWFRFWLAGEEDDSEGKADQYSHWRHLRSYKEAPENFAPH